MCACVFLFTSPLQVLVFPNSAACFWHMSMKFSTLNGCHSNSGLHKSPLSLEKSDLPSKSLSSRNIKVLKLPALEFALVIPEISLPSMFSLSYPHVFMSDLASKSYCSDTILPTIPVWKFEMKKAPIHY